MTDKDRKLIEEAEKIGFTEWPEILRMSDQADTEEARRKLKQIASFNMHFEEYLIGNM